MIKSFKKEVRLLKSNNRITEKLMTMAIYNEFFNDIMDNIDANERDAYATVIEKNFELVVRGINSHKNRNVTAKRLMEIYFSSIKNNKLFTTPRITKIINDIESKLDNASSILSFVEPIDNFDNFSLDTKVNVLVQFRDYANDLFNSTKEQFGNKCSISYDVLELLINELIKYLNYCEQNNINPNVMCNNIKVNMKNSIKKSLMTKVATNEFATQYVRNNDDFSNFDSLNELEQKIILMNSIYDIVGYSNTKNGKKAAEICDFLNISKIRYNLTNMLISLKNLNNEDNINKNTRNR